MQLTRCAQPPRQARPWTSAQRSQDESDEDAWQPAPASQQAHEAKPVPQRQLTLALQKVLPGRVMLLRSITSHRASVFVGLAAAQRSGRTKHLSASATRAQSVARPHPHARLENLHRRRRSDCCPCCELSLSNGKLQVRQAPRCVSRLPALLDHPILSESPPVGAKSKSLLIFVFQLSRHCRVQFADENSGWGLRKNENKAWLGEAKWRSCCGNGLLKGEGPFPLAGAMTNIDAYSPNAADPILHGDSSGFYTWRVSSWVWAVGASCLREFLRLRLLRPGQPSPPEGESFYSAPD